MLASGWRSSRLESVSDDPAHKPLQKSKPHVQSSSSTSREPGEYNVECNDVGDVSGELDGDNITLPGNDSSYCVAMP